MSVSFAFAMLTGMPAVADDTELLLVNPDPSLSPNPNVMFILDTSGSMTTTQSTIEPYDSVVTYGGDCDSSKLYWTDVDVTPDCATTKNIIDGGSYVCEFSRNQINGIGSAARNSGKRWRPATRVNMWSARLIRVSTVMALMRRAFGLRVVQM